MVATVDADGCEDRSLGAADGGELGVAPGSTVVGVGVGAPHPVTSITRAAIIRTRFMGDKHTLGSADPRMDPMLPPARHVGMPVAELLSLIVAVLLWIALLGTLEQP